MVKKFLYIVDVFKDQQFVHSQYIEMDKLSKTFNFIKIKRNIYFSMNIEIIC